MTADKAPAEALEPNQDWLQLARNIDAQTRAEMRSYDHDPPDDAEFSITVTAKERRWLFDAREAGGGPAQAPSAGLREALENLLSAADQFRVDRLPNNEKSLIELIVRRKDLLSLRDATEFACAALAAPAQPDRSDRKHKSLDIALSEDAEDLVRDYPDIAGRIVRAVMRLRPVQPDQPIPMILYCPACGTRHVDRVSREWNNPPHRSHLCHACGNIWRPADVATVGVEKIETCGQSDAPQVSASEGRSAGPTREEVAHLVWCMSDGDMTSEEALSAGGRAHWKAWSIQPESRDAWMTADAILALFQPPGERV